MSSEILQWTPRHSSTYFPGYRCGESSLFLAKKVTSAVLTKAEDVTTKIDGAAAISSEGDDGIARQLTPLSAKSSRCEDLVDAFSVEDVSVGGVAEADGIDDTTGTDETHAEDVFISANTKNMRLVNGGGRFSKTAFGSMQQGLMANTSFCDNEAEPWANKAPPDKQHVERVGVGGTALRAGLVKTGAFFRAVWGLTKDALEVNTRRRSGKAKVNRGAIIWRQKTRHAVEGWRRKYSEDVETLLLRESVD